MIITTQTGIDAIVPAFNEESTIADVVSVLCRSPSYRRVIVVDDGSTDSTANNAALAGAYVLRLKKNLGKGGAMREAFRYTTTDPVAFFDADLIGFQLHHAELLALHARSGFDMVVGIRDYGLLRNALQSIGPLISGERIIRRWILDKMPTDCWSGYAVETGINFSCSRSGGRTVLVPMKGVSIRFKTDKFGLLSGLVKEYKMFSRIYQTENMLRRCGKCSST